MSGLMSVTALFLTAVAPAGAVDVSQMDVVFSDSFDDLSNWKNVQRNDLPGAWVADDSPSGWGTGYVAFIDLTDPHIIGKNNPQNLITNTVDPIDLTGYNTVILQFDSSGISTKRGNQKEKVIVTDEHGVQYVVWSKSKATFTGIQQVDISNYVAGNKSINLTFQYVKKGPAKDSRWEVDDLKILGCTTGVKPYRTIQFNSSAYTVVETDGAFAVLNLTCIPASQGTVTVNWSASDGTAVAGTNYGNPGDTEIDVSGMVTFNAGDTYQLIQIPIMNDLHFSDPDLTFNVSIEDVTDATGNTIPGTPNTAEVTIIDSNSELSPVVTILSPSSEINEGSSWSGSGSFTEPGSGISWTARVDYGDGSGVQDLTLTDMTFALDHTYTDNGNYLVNVTVTNNNEISGSDYFDVTVNSVAPTATFNTNSPVNEGSDIVVSLTDPSDPSSVDTTAEFTYAFDLGSGYGDFGSSSTASLAAADNGVVTVKGKIMDKDGDLTEYTADVTVNNVAPTLTLSGASSAEVGATYTLSLSSSDPGADTITSWSINWGDGSVEPVSGNPGSVTHVYAVSNDYTISATATDEDGTYDAGNTVAVNVGTGIVAYTIQLKQGWNLISFPVVNTTLKASDLTGTGVQTVSSYNMTTGDYDSYIIGISPSSYDITMKTDVGYFVYCTTDTSIVVYGPNPSDRSISINPGWNLIGWSSFTSSTAKAVCAEPSLSGMQTISKYNAATGDYDSYIEGVSPDSYDFVMSDGIGYFVYTGSATPQTLYFEVI